jgi:predicted dehydrogenase
MQEPLKGRCVMGVVRIGMVGARHGATLHLENLGSMRGQQVDVVGICAQSRDSAEACARRYGIPFVTTDFAALLERKDVDAVDLTNALLHANMVQNTAVQAYAPDPGIFGQEYCTEKLETKAGWTSPSPDEGWFRGYPQEMRDFVEAIRDDREPLAGVDLAVDCIEVIYAAYLSAAEGRRVALRP